MTTFTTCTLYQTGEFSGDFTERVVVLRSTSGESLRAAKFGAFGRWYSAQAGKPNSWTICNISEFPDRDTFEHVTGGF